MGTYVQSKPAIAPVTCTCRQSGEGADAVVIIGWRARFDQEDLAARLSKRCRVIEFHTSDLNYAHVDTEVKLAELRKLLTGAGRVVFYGSSRGGHGAILYSARLKMEGFNCSFVAVCPQAYYDAQDVQLRQLTHIQPEVYGGDLLSLPLTNGLIVYSDLPLDVRHAKLLARPGIALQYVPFSEFRSCPRVSNPHHLTLWLDAQPSTESFLFNWVKNDA